MKDLIRSWALVLLLSSFSIVSPITPLVAQNLELPADYAIDLQLAESGRSRIMKGKSAITGSPANGIGEEVFHRLISASTAPPYAWQLTLVNNGVVNAFSTAGGKVYVDGGLLSLIGRSQGLWAAVLSHETAHTVLRHQVRIVLLEMYNQRMIQYYRARVAAGDNSANYSLIGFAAASRIALKKIERDQEHDADQQGMLLMSRAGYHPDFVFALHHLLLMNTGEQSKFAAFFSDHPRWETRDQRSDGAYADALAEFNRLWPDAASSPGGLPPTVAFLGQPVASADKQTHTADVVLPAYCRNSTGPIDLLVAFRKKGHPVPAAGPEFADKEGNLAVQGKADCLEKNETTPMRISIPASAVNDRNRSVKAKVYVSSHGELIAASKEFDVHFPSADKAPSNGSRGVVEMAQANTEVKMSNNNGSVPAKTTQGLIGPDPSRTQPTATVAPPSKPEDEGTLAITSTSEGAEIFVDSTGHGKTPATLKLKPGKHSVQVVLTGYQDWVQDISVKVGETATILANLLPVRTSADMSNSAMPAPAQTIRVEVPTSPNIGQTESVAANYRYPGGIGVNGIAGAYGVIITEVISGDPAQEAGLKIGDTIIGVDNKPIKTLQMLESLPSVQASGSKMEVSYIRNGVAAETTLTLQGRSHPDPPKVP